MSENNKKPNSNNIILPNNEIIVSTDNNSILTQSNSFFVHKYNELKNKIILSVEDGKLSKQEYNSLINSLESIKININVLKSIEDGGYINSKTLSEIIGEIKEVFNFLNIGPISQEEMEQLLSYKIYLNSIYTSNNYPQFLKESALNIDNLISDIINDDYVTELEFKQFTTQYNQFLDVLNAYLESSQMIENLSSDISGRLDNINENIKNIEIGNIKPSQLVDILNDINELVKDILQENTWEKLQVSSMNVISESLKSLILCILDAVYTNDEQGDNGLCEDVRYKYLNNIQQEENNNEIKRIQKFLLKWWDKDNPLNSSLEIILTDAGYIWEVDKNNNKLFKINNFDFGENFTTYTESFLEFNKIELLQIQYKFDILKNLIKSSLITYDVSDKKYIDLQIDIDKTISALKSGRITLEQIESLIPMLNKINELLHSKGLIDESSYLKYKQEIIIIYNYLIVTNELYNKVQETNKYNLNSSTITITYSPDINDIFDNFKNIQIKIIYNTNIIGQTDTIENFNENINENINDLNIFIF